MNKPSQLQTNVSTDEIAYVYFDSLEMEFFEENWAVIPHPLINSKQWANKKVDLKCEQQPTAQPCVIKPCVQQKM